LNTIIAGLIGGKSLTIIDMPISVHDLITTVGLNTRSLRTVKWGNSVDSTSKGIYIVSTSGQPNENTNLYESAPIDVNTLRIWLNKVPSLEIDGKRSPSISELKSRLSGFWLPDECILYIGQTESGNGLKGRVNQYYNTELGERKPHAGGHWIKTLSIINQLFIHYIPTIAPVDTEEKLLNHFVKQVSKGTKSILLDSHLSLPFANLELEIGKRKKHGISKSKLGD
jgi:hypothetical protein